MNLGFRANSDMEEDGRQAEFAIRLYHNRASKYNASWHPSFAATFASMMPLSPGQRVLDLACGTGLLSFDMGVIVGSTGQVVGVDITPNMLKEARDRKKLENDTVKHIEFHECDVMKLEKLENLEKESFDAVTMASALVLFDDPAVVIKNMMSYLKPGGVIGVDCTHPRDILAGILIEKVALKMGLKMPYHRTWANSESSLRDLLEKEGFIIEKYEFVEQRGFGKRYHEIDQAEQVFDELLEGETIWVIKEKGLEAVAKARELFKEEWQNSAVDGKVEEVDGVYVAIARKPATQSTRSANVDIVFEGGCRCGKVRYNSSHAPESINHCHCFTCGRLSGCGFLPFTRIPRSAFQHTASEKLATQEITDQAARTFCGGCGAPITMEYHSEPDNVWLVVGSIDLNSLKVELPKVSSHIFMKEKLSWDAIPDDGAKRLDTMSTT